MTDQTSRASRPVLSSARDLLDIIVLVVFSLAVDAAIEALARGHAPSLVMIFAAPVACLIFTWLLLRFRGQRFSDIGLATFGNPVKTLLLAVIVAAALWTIAWVTESAGLQRNFSNLRPYLENNPAYLAAMVFYGLFGAGFYEEVTFRGFLLQRFAHMFGSTRLAWGLAAVAQGVLFGLAHAHQGVYGILYTGGLSIAFAIILLATGRNLWPLILGHACYDASRFVYLYWSWAHGS